MPAILSLLLGSLKPSSISFAAILVGVCFAAILGGVFVVHHYVTDYHARGAEITRLTSKNATLTETNQNLANEIKQLKAADLAVEAIDVKNHEQSQAQAEDYAQIENKLSADLMAAKSASVSPTAAPVPAPVKTPPTVAKALLDSAWATYCMAPSSHDSQCSSQETHP